MARAALSLYGLALLVACSDPAPSAAEAVEPPAVATCAADEHASTDGTCELFATAVDCAPGTRPAVGSETCLPVGPTGCAAGFAKDASGWGCAPVLPTEPCTGATRPRLGDRACVAVGDCAAAFPPAGAILVDPTLADAAVDATHVRTVDAALAIAGAGGVVALADGEHVTGRVTSLQKAVTVVGRCAAKVRLVPPAERSIGLDVRAKVTVRGLTLEGYVGAFVATGAAAEVLAEDVVVQGARSRGVVATSNARITMRRSVVRGTVPLGASDQTIAVAAGAGGKISLEETAVLAGQDGAVASVDGTATRVSLARSVVQDTKPRPDGVEGAALRAFEGAHLDVTESAVLGSSGIAVLALRRTAPPPEVTITRSVIGSTRTANEVGTAVNAAFEAIVRIDESTVADSDGAALYAAEQAKLTFTRSVVVRVVRTPETSSRGGTSIKGAELVLDESAVVGAGAAGLGVWDGGHLKVSRSLVRDIGGDVTEGLPRGAGFEANLSSTIDVSDSAVVDALELGVSATKRSVVRLDRFLLTRSPNAPPARFGYGLLALDGASFDVTRSLVERQGGVALFVASGGGVVASSLIRDNAVAVHVQDTSTVVEAEARPEAVPAEELVILEDTRFVGNATRIGAGVLPLPSPLPAP